MNSRIAKIARNSIATLTGLAILSGGLVGIVATPASAATPYSLDANCELTGDGNSATPFQIATVGELLQMEECFYDSVNGDNLESSEVFFEQTRNIYLDPLRSWPTSEFDLTNHSLRYNGQGYAIVDFQMSVGGPAGLFSEVFSNGDVPGQTAIYVQDLQVVATDISASNDFQEAGTLFGNVSSVDVVLSGITVLANSIQGEADTGGLIGRAYRSQLTIEDSMVVVNSISSTTGDRAGGLVGEWRGNGNTSVIHNTTISAALADANVNDTVDMGGFVGRARDGHLLIRESIFSGSVIGAAESWSIGGGVGMAISYDGDPVSLTFRDTVIDAEISGGTIGGFVGYTHNHDYDFNLDPDLDPNKDIPVTIENSIFTGELRLREEAYVGDSGGLVGMGDDAILTVSKTVLDAEFTKETGTPEGSIISRPPASRTISDLYVNQAKVDAATWSLFNISGDSPPYWGATLVPGANFGAEASFSGLGFSTPNTGPAAGVWEVCTGIDRPIHSIEPSHCDVPSINYAAEFTVALGAPVEIAFTGNAANYSTIFVSPELPKGLILNPRTGVIKGRALEAASNDYTVTAAGAWVGGSPVITQDTFSLSTVAGVVTFQPNQSGLQGSLQLDTGLVELPANPFTGSAYEFVGWSVGSASGTIYAVGDEVLIIQNEDVYARWAIPPDCGFGTGAPLAGNQSLCSDADGFSITRYGSDFVEDDGYGYFVGTHPVLGRQLFRTDGAATGTELVLNLGRSGVGRVNELFAIMDGKFLIHANKAGTSGLYISNGTYDGTQLLTTSYPYPGVVVGDSFFFDGYDDTNGWELWVTDGTQQGTAIVKNINPTTGSDPFGFIEWRNAVVFQADDGTSGIELWASDGTSAGTSLLVDLGPGSADSYPVPLAVSGNKLYFKAEEDGLEGLYVLNNPGDEPLKLVVGDVSTGMQLPGTELFVFGHDTDSNSTENELWITDGTVAGTRKILDIGTANVDGYPSDFSAVESGLHFNARDVLDEWHVWFTDGTESGTRKLFPSSPGLQVLGTVGEEVVLFSDKVDGIYRLTDPSELEQQESQQQPGSPSATPPVTSGVGTFDLVSRLLKLPGTTLSDVRRVSLQGKALFSKFEDAALHVMIPEGLAPGTYSLELTSSSGTTTIQDAFTIESSIAATSISAWTKNLGNGTVKFYAKNIVGVGKVQFMHNGKEIAWVRATSSTDPKLRNANGASYLVRTVSLSAGKNALEIHVDGERVRRVAYTG